MHAQGQTTWEGKHNLFDGEGENFSPGSENRVREHGWEVNIHATIEPWTSNLDSTHMNYFLMHFT